MSQLISTFPISSTTPGCKRRTANYPPSIWGDCFLAHASDDSMTTDSCMQEKLTQLREEVRKMLMDQTHKPVEMLNMIDTIQRLCLSYYFDKEIEIELGKLFHNWVDTPDHDLYSTALSFRLFRQQGYLISCDVFEKFKDEDGNFKRSLVDEPNGLLSLYEASHLRIDGEKILDEALAFATTHLESISTQVNLQMSQQIIHALNRPIHRNIPSIEARQYLSVYERDGSHNVTILELAKLDFNMLQVQYQRELRGILKWWRSTECETKLPYAKNRVVELFFWITAMYFEPQYSLARILLTKMVSIISILDDTFDIYGTIEELKLLTEAIERMDKTSLELLPNYMRVIYQLLSSVFCEIEESVGEGRLRFIHYAKQAFKELCKAYLVEAEWYHKDYVPTTEEYMSVARVSCAYPAITTIGFVVMGEAATEEAFTWLLSDPLILTSTTIICRLMDDIATHEVEQERGDVASAVECYMKQHGVSKEETIGVFQKQITDAWKSINKDCLKPTALPMPLLTPIINLARAMDVIYKDGDGYTNAHLIKDYVTSLLIDRVTV